MKCKHCDGTGTTNWCVNGTFVDCPYCGGTGEMEVEQEPMTECVKIKCDDCKFVEDCVDYGWDGCKKFTQKASEPQTNEEWFCNLSTEEKAKVLRRRTYGNDEDNESVEQGWINWLKAKHEDNPPNIPSVPSWDKWLEGERTKCEYCDGNGVECELYGRSECPKTPKTEQEWLQTCNTEQLAEFLTKFILDDKRFRMTMVGGVNETKLWLKQPHEQKGETEWINL